MSDDPKSVKSLRAYYKTTIEAENLGALMNAVEPESDRAAVVIFASIIEDALTQRLRSRMKPFEEAKEFERIFQFDGPLGTFSAKIDLGCSLGVIEEMTRERLHLLREMRNACAHSMKPISLQTPELWNVFVRFVAPPLGLPQRLNRDWDAPEHRRRSFVAQAALLAQIVMIGKIIKTMDRLIARLKLPAEPPPSPDKPQSRSKTRDSRSRTAKALRGQPQPSQGSRQAKARVRRRKGQPPGDTTPGG